MRTCIVYISKTSAVTCSGQNVREVVAIFWFYACPAARNPLRQRPLGGAVEVGLTGRERKVRDEVRISAHSARINAPTDRKTAKSSQGVGV